MPQAVSQPPGIFICYRRDDRYGHAGRLFDNLRIHFGDEQIFIDVEKIKPGRDFTQALNEALDSCEVLLALIDREWLTRLDEAGQPRLTNPDDFVHREIAAALKREIVVIPVLLPGARMPKQEELPEDLSRLPDINAIELSDRHWHWKHDIAKLIGVIDEVFAERREKLRKEEERQKEENERRREEEECVQKEEEERRRRVADVERRKQAAKEPAEPEPAPVGRGTSSSEQQWRKIKRLAGDVSARTRRLLPTPVVRWGVLLIVGLLFSMAAAAFFFPSVAKLLVNRIFVSKPVVENPAAAQPSPAEAVNAVQSRTPREFRNAVGMEFVWVPPGEFVMGSDNGPADERPAQRITVNTGFYMGKYEVTQDQWQSIMDSNPSHFKGENLPVEKVSWDDAQQFIERLNRMNDGYNYRLPTEMDWEYAARGGTTGDYAGDVDSMAWYSRNSGSSTHPVGQKQPNWFGLYDMQGNVCEWALDTYQLYSERAPTDGRASPTGAQRVTRGCSWSGGDLFCRSPYRGRLAQDSRKHFVGFRVAAIATR